MYTNIGNELNWYQEPYSFLCPVLMITLLRLYRKNPKYRKESIILKNLSHIISNTTISIWENNKTFNCWLYAATKKDFCNDMEMF